MQQSKTYPQSGGGNTTARTGITADVLPETQRGTVAESSKTGVSTNSIHWYALRTTYGRERKAYQYLTDHGVTAFLPTITTTRLVNGKRRSVAVSRLPNIFFARGTEDMLKEFVYDNVHLPFLRFYYRHFHDNNTIKKQPMIVPDRQMETLRIICESESDDLFVAPVEIHKFETGRLVQVVNGPFKGAEGRVARVRGNQRVGICIDGLLTIATAYVPTAFLKIIEE